MVGPFWLLPCSSLFPHPETYNGRMKRAALYARVSSDLQKKEGTIASQVIELKKQIAAVGGTLVKEYVDDGYSGASFPTDDCQKILISGSFHSGTASRRLRSTTISSPRGLLRSIRKS